MNPLTFIQLSDIHFTRHSGDSYDVDNDQRCAVIEDIKHRGSKVISQLDGILVCGDIAFSATEDEYGKAIDFLKEITGIFGISLDKVFCVAGNHDVDQKITKESQLLLLAQKHLVDTAKNGLEYIDDEIRKIQNDPFERGILLKHLDNYNKSVAQMTSGYSLDRPNWEVPLNLDDGYQLVIYGMNSVMTSNHLDHIDDNGNRLVDTERQMVINRKQIPGSKHKRIYLTMCHHPPECWINQELQKPLDGRAKIQLYGHKHIQSIDVTDERLRIYSGAIGPEKGLGRCPQYNWIKIGIEDEKLIVDIYPRIYDDVQDKFRPEEAVCDAGEDFKRCILTLGKSENTQKESVLDEQEDDSGTRIIDQKIKKIVYRLYTLSDIEKIELKAEYPDREMDFSDQGIDDIVDWIQSENRADEFLKKLEETER